MSRARGCAASAFRPKVHSRESLNLESLVIRSVKSGMNRAKRRAASRFSPKLQIRAKSLSLESLVIRSGKSGHESRQGSRRIRI